MEVSNNVRENDRPKLMELNMNINTERANQRGELGKAKKGICKRLGKGERKEIAQSCDLNKENIGEKEIKRGRELEGLEGEKQVEEG